MSDTRVYFRGTTETMDLAKRVRVKGTVDANKPEVMRETDLVPVD